jgi:hypothetical protein
MASSYWTFRMHGSNSEVLEVNHEGSVPGSESKRAIVLARSTLMSCSVQSVERKGRRSWRRPAVQQCAAGSAPGEGCPLSRSARPVPCPRSQIGWLVCVPQRRSACDDAQVREAGKARDDVFSQPLRQGRKIRAAATVFEGQHDHPESFLGASSIRRPRRPR